jgi:ribonuclease I
MSNNANVVESKTSRLLKAFQAGEKLTAGEIKNRFNIANPRAAVSALRMKGYAVYLNEGTLDERGRRRASRYKIGTPMRKVVAAGYKALAAQGISV